MKNSCFDFIRNTYGNKSPNTIGKWFLQKILNINGNKGAYWSVHFTSKILSIRNIHVGIDASPGIWRGCYIQGIGKINIGDHTQIGPNVTIVSANHDLYDIRKHIPKEVHIGSYCQIEAGAKIMPGIKLGDFTIVEAGTVVTKSFPEGYCVISGNPAKEIRKLDQEKCIRYSNRYAYNGYIPNNHFLANPEKYFNV
ncbi:MAG: acyltransferase [Chitinophagaceae bacterium]|nr:acyltransferase [Chitinophagaceae bacterium]